jgi:hypothetical protein
MLMLQPKEERARGMELCRMWQRIDDPEAVVGSVSESIPYRKAAEIHSLFDKYGIAITDTVVFDSCTVVRIDNKAAGHQGN